MRFGLKPHALTSAFFDLLPDCLPDSFRTLPEPRPKTPNLQGFRIASGRFRMAWGLSKDLKSFMWRAPQKIKERRKTERESSRLQQNPRKFIVQWCMKLSNQVRRKPFPACFPGSGVAKASSGAAGAGSGAAGASSEAAKASSGAPGAGSGSAGAGPGAAKASSAAAGAGSGAAGASSGAAGSSPGAAGASSTNTIASGRLPDRFRKAYHFSCAPWGKLWR